MDSQSIEFRIRPTGVPELKRAYTTKDGFFLEGTICQFMDDCVVVYRKEGTEKFKEASYGEFKSGEGDIFTVKISDNVMGLKNNTVYEWAVYPASVTEFGDSVAGKNTSNIVSFRNYNPPKLTSVKNTSAKAITVKWKKNALATGYEIRYTIGHVITPTTSKTVKVKKGKTTSKTIKKLKKGKTYYVAMRSYIKSDGETIYSAWGESKQVKIKK